MPSKLPVVSGRQVIKALAKVGYVVDHQTGSHVIMRQKEEPHRRITVLAMRRSLEGGSGPYSTR